VRVFRQKFAPKDAIPLWWPLLLPVHIVNRVQTLKAAIAGWKSSAPLNPDLIEQLPASGSSNVHTVGDDDHGNGADDGEVLRLCGQGSVSDRVLLPSAVFHRGVIWLLEFYLK
jgi:hypothetical protein